MFERYVLIFDLFLCIFSTVTIRDLGSGIGCPERIGSSDEVICGIINVEVAMAIRDVIQELFGFVKTTQIEEFDGCCVTVTQVTDVTTTAVVASVGLQGGERMQYREFSNTKPPKFSRDKNLIVCFRWISYVDG